MSALPFPDGLEIVRAVSQLEPRSLEWLWPGRLALGKLAILDGDPGLGKSLLTLDLCARLSTGSPWPDGSLGPGPANALVLNGEDGPEDTIRPRLEALGTDINRVFVPHRGKHDALPLLRLPGHTAVLERALARSDARLLVLDPVVAFLDPSVLGGSDQAVRQALLPLAWLAEQYRCAVLLVRHLNKTASHRALYRGGGSIGLAGACRSSWLVEHDPRNPPQRVLAQVKNNLAGPQPSLSYELCHQPDGPPRLCWHGPCTWTANELLAGAAALPGASPRERACHFLTTFLHDGPKTAREVWTAALKLGLAEKTLKRAKRVLKVRTVRVVVNHRQSHYWLLPHQDLTALQPANADDAELEAWLAPLRKQFPPSTPLDELS